VVFEEILKANMPDQDETRREMFEHAWRYFALHAQQRMSVFNFFLILSGVVAAGVAACLQRSGPYRLLGVGLGVLLGLVSFVFYKLDQRTSSLIKHSEEAIAELEQSFPNVAARLVFNERHRARITPASGFVLIRLWTYGTAFRSVFAGMAFVGIVGAILCLAQYWR
jgi:hypothetical protein